MVRRGCAANAKSSATARATATGTNVARLTAVREENSSSKGRTTQKAATTLGRRQARPTAQGAHRAREKRRGALLLVQSAPQLARHAMRCAWARARYRSRPPHALGPRERDRH